MFDVKFILVLIPLVVLLFLAYNEISDIKKNVKLLTTELKSQTTNITQNVSQCVERIEKISQSHISELQTINKMNLQQINRVNCIRIDGEDESEGLSSNYMSPNEKDIPEVAVQGHHLTQEFAHKQTLPVTRDADLHMLESEKLNVTHSRITRDGTTTKDGNAREDVLPTTQTSKKQDDLYLSDDEHKKITQKSDEQVSQIPVYIPQGIPEMSEQDDSESIESSQDTSEFIDDQLKQSKDDAYITPEDFAYNQTITAVPEKTEHIISLNNIEHFAGLVGMSEIFGGSTILSQNTLHGTGPIIEALTDEEIVKNQSANIEITNPNTEVSSHIDEISEKISHVSNKKSEHDSSSVLSQKSQLSKKSTSSQSSHSNHSEEEKSTLLDITEYTLKELQELAKQKGIVTSTKVDGKLKQYRKQELYNVLLSKK